MWTCETCQTQMLEYLYDLLDEGDRQQFQEHLAACPACQATLRQAQGQQSLLAAAARMEFPDVRFQAPVETPATLPLPAAQPAPAATCGSGKRRAWKRWAVAAAVLLAIGVGVPGFWLARDYAEASRVARQNETVIAQRNAEMTDINRMMRDLPRERDGKVESIRQEVRDRQLKVVITGPATVQSGAPTEYRIQTTSLTGQPAPAQLTVRLADEAGQQSAPLAVVATGDGEGHYRLVLPPDLPVKPSSHLTMLVCAKREGGTAAEVYERLPITRAVYFTHLATDKAMYQPGEVVYFRSLTLDRATLKPAQEPLRFLYTLSSATLPETVIVSGANALQAHNPAKGFEPVLGPDGQPIRGIGSGAYQIDPHARGGEYTLTVREELGRFPEQQRKFTVNEYQKPRLNKELEFNKKSYGVGEEVQALCKALRADGGAVSEKNVEVTVNIDGKAYGADGKPNAEPFKFKTDTEGRVTVRFRLPGEIEKGQASASVKFDDGANTEAIVRTIPIVLKNLDVEFFPEGGDLVAGLPNRVYFQARTALGKPADLKGHLLEDGKPLPVEVQTLTDDKQAGVNQGMGRFEFTPVAERAYQLQIESPAGINKRFALPMAKTEGVVLRLDEGVIKPNQPIKVKVQSKGERILMVGAYCRGRLLDSVQLKKGQTEVALKPASTSGGVCRVTVFEQQEAAGNRHELKPVAERLIYRQPSEELTVVIRPDQSSYVPGQKAKLVLDTLNEKEEPTPAVVMVGVVDKSVVTMADEKTARSMPTHFLLTTEVRKPEDLEHADFLLGPHPRASQALDLLLGTQGWRRFAEQNPAKFRQAQKLDAERLLVTIGQSGPQITDFAQEQILKVCQEYREKGIALMEKQNESAVALQEVRGDAAYLAALVRLKNYHQLLEQIRLTATPVLAALLVLGLLITLVLALSREIRRALPYYATAAGFALVLVLVFKVPSLDRQTLPPGEVAQGPAPNLEEEANKNPLNPDVLQVIPGIDQVGTGEPGRGGTEIKVTEATAAKPVPPPGVPLPKLFANDPNVNLKADEQALRKQLLEQLDGGKDDKAGFRELQLALKNKKGDAKDKDKEREKADRAEMAKDARGAAGKEGKGVRDFDDLLGKRRRFPAGQPGAGPGDLAQLPTMTVREYAHHRVTGSRPDERSDFTETLFWHPVIVLPKGKAEVSFELCDSVTSFEVMAFGHTLDGRLGAATLSLDSRLPFTLQPKTPIEVTSSDRIAIPLSISNNTDEKRKVEVRLEQHRGLSLLDGEGTNEFEITPQSAIRKVYRFQPDIKEGEALLVYRGKTDPFAADAIRTTFRVVPEGFPMAGSHSDMLEGTVTTRVVLPEAWVKGTLKLQAQAFPSTLASLQKGLEGLLREPHGCFEQTSTSNYPNLLILDYLRESNQAQPEVERRARELLGRGYQKLTSFECLNTGKSKREGYEWFGGTAPAHEALTAYGLMQFRDMTRVHDVDQEMLQRTNQYLLSQRDGKGGFIRNPRALDTFGRAPDHITNAYIVWALTESGKDDDLSTELKALGEKAGKSRDPYFLALVANSLVNRSRTEEGVKLLQVVAEVQKEDGHLDAEQTSITGSGGQALQIETTALAVLGWLKADPVKFTKVIDKAVKWIGTQRGGYGGFGSTQSTILALKALIAFARQNKKTAENGELTLHVDGKKVASLPFKAGVAETLTLDLTDAEKHLKSGENKVRLDVTGKNVFPCTIGWTYQTLQPASAANCPVKLTTSLAKASAKEADMVRLTVKVENVSGKGQGMAVAIIGLPGGMNLPEDLKQLKDYTRTPEDGSRPLVSAFEVRGREVVLYWRDLAPEQKIEVPVDLLCRVPGEYSGPASRAYLYYNADFKHWVEPLKVSIAPREE